MDHLSFHRAQQILDSAKGRRIAVLGDFMLDRHLKGTVNRISPEAPVPVVEIESETTGLGGAGNVVDNLASLAAQPLALGVIGDDAAGLVMRGHLEAVGADAQCMIVSKGRRTTEKVRIIARDQHVVRADYETTEDISAGDAERLLDCLDKMLPTLDALILQDYNKGVLSKPVIDAVLQSASAHRVPVAIDPKFDNFFAFKKVHLFKPNVRELERAMGARAHSDELLHEMGRKLFERMSPDLLLVTRGEKGMALFVGRERIEHIPTSARKVHDVSGAGDTVIATFTVAETGGASPEEAAILANHAAGIVCGEVGVVPIDRERLIAALAGPE